MATARIRKGDEVIVITGKDKGRRGTVLQVLSNGRVLVEGVNITKRHQKGDPRQGTSGDIIDKELPIHVSNVAVYNSTTQRGDRIGFRHLEDGRKVRYFKSTGEVVDI
jgi:large subunit ribosomal protein L24